MIAFLVKRIGNAILVMLTVAFFAFLIFRFLGDPVELMVNESATQVERDELRSRLGLNDGFLVQYVRFVANAAQGEFGLSWRNQQNVITLIAERFPATFELVIIATILSLVIGIPLGVFTAIGRGRWWAEGMQFSSIVGVSLPSFFVGIILILVFSVSLGWLPGYGRGEVVRLGWWSTGLLTPSGRAAVILPALSLSLFQITLVMRLVRAEMLEVLRSDYISFARARGLTTRAIHFGHALKNTLVPVITVAGLQFGSVIAFAIITETVFQWPGMGLLFIQAISMVDIPVMAAYLVLIAFMFVVINLVVDLLYFAVDPRLRVQSK